MATWTEQQRIAYELRRGYRRDIHPGIAPPDACEQESELHRQILAECARREWLVVHSRMDEATTFTTEGVSDFLIYLPNGKTLIVEAKRRGEKATPKQLGFLAHAKKLGHPTGVVWSFKQFLELVSSEFIELVKV